MTKQKRKSGQNSYSIHAEYLFIILIVIVGLIAIIGSTDSNSNCGQTPSFMQVQDQIYVTDAQYRIANVTSFTDFNGEEQIIIETRHEKFGFDLFLFDGETANNVAATGSKCMEQTNVTVSADGYSLIYQQYVSPARVSEEDSLILYDLFNKKHRVVQTEGIPSNPVFVGINMVAYESLNIEQQSESIYLTDLYQQQQTWQISSSYQHVESPSTDVSGVWISWREDDGTTPTVLHNVHTGITSEFGITPGAMNIEWAPVN